MDRSAVGLLSIVEGQTLCSGFFGFSKSKSKSKSKTKTGLEGTNQR